MTRTRKSFRHIEPTGARFAPPTDFDPKAYAKNAFGITGGEKPIKVRLLFEPKLAVYITERQWHPSQEFHMPRDGRVASPKKGPAKCTGF